MCGFAGYLSSKHFDHPTLLNNMAMAIEHRGPDASGIWFDADAGIAISHRRLSILDLSEAGAQPMISQTGRYILAFNGEVYNFQEIRADLEKDFQRINWRGHSDTEIILVGFEKWGFAKTLKRMTGMFAIVLWDRETKELFLARDRMGEKPLYFGWQNKSFLFGSELKALHQHPEFKKDISLEALGEFFKYNFVPSGTSIYKGISKLKPGTYCKVSLANQEIANETYWDIDESIQPDYEKSNSVNDYIDRLESLIKDSVNKQMAADVPIGAFLSGGVDSSLIVALMQNQSNNPVKTFSIGFNEKKFDEAIYAKQVAQYIGTDHTEMYVSAQEARNVIPYLSEIYDEPFADSSQIPTYLVSKLAKSKITVSLSGDAGDELFGGYGKYSRLNNLWKGLSKVPVPIRKKIGKVFLNKSVNAWDSNYKGIEYLIPGKFRHSDFGDKMHKIGSVLGAASRSELHDGYISHWNSNDIINAEIKNNIYNLETPKDVSFMERMMIMDSKTYLIDDILAKVDRAAMAVSLETRIPLLDYRIVEFALNLPLNLKMREGKGKWILREILYRHVPQKLVDRKKMGFSIPLDIWLRGPLKEWANDLLSSSNLDKHGLLNKRVIHDKLEQHMSGKQNWQFQLWDVLMFQSWYNKYH